MDRCPLLGRYPSRSCSSTLSATLASRARVTTCSVGYAATLRLLTGIAAIAVPAIMLSVALFILTRP